MAGSKKSGSSSKAKSGGAKKGGNTKKAQTKPSSGSKTESQKDPVNQFWSVILFAAGILVFLLTVIEGSSGWYFIHNLFRGLFGVSVFLVPVILVYTAILISMERSQQTVAGRAMWGIGLTLLCSSVVQIMFAGEAQGSSFTEKCRYLYESGSNLEGGGLLSALIAWPLLKFFGNVGAKIIVCVLLFIFIMLLSNLTLFQFFGFFYKPFVKMYHSLQELREENRILDAYEEWEYDEEQEAISLANSQNNESDTVPDDDFNFDVPVNENDNIDLPDFEPPKLSSQNGSAIDIPIDGVLQSESD